MKCIGKIDTVKTYKAKDIHEYVGNLLEHLEAHVSYHIGILGTYIFIREEMTVDEYIENLIMNLEDRFKEKIEIQTTEHPNKRFVIEFLCDDRFYEKHAELHGEKILTFNNVLRGLFQ